MKADDHVVYLNTCACLPLYQQIVRIVGEHNLQATTGPHESIDVEDEWATLVIGQCILDEFQNASKSTSEIARVLRNGGRAIVSGPVSRNRRLKFERQGKPAQEFFSLRDVEAELSQHGLRPLVVHNLTENIKTELRRSDRQPSMLDFESLMDYVLIEATRETKTT